MITKREIIWRLSDLEIAELSIEDDIVEIKKRLKALEPKKTVKKTAKKTVKKEK